MMTANKTEKLGEFFEMMVETKSHHASNTHYYQFVKSVCSDMFAQSGLRNPEGEPIDFGPFGKIVIPYYAMGAIDTIDLFGLDELIIFAFYNANRNKYRNTVDIGANMGLHSILMARCGYKVRAFEPDPVHYDLLKRNLALNSINEVDVIKAAVSDKDGSMEFVRVKGNTTGSHLAGAKANPYGDLERFPVDVKSFTSVLDQVDFAKIDAEGHEVIILRSLPAEYWRRLDVMLEVGTVENASALFEHFKSMPVNLFAQKIGWNQVTKVSDMPTSHREGSLFITAKSEMPWG